MYSAEVLVLKVKMVAPVAPRFIDAGGAKIDCPLVESEEMTFSKLRGGLDAVATIIAGRALLYDRER